MLSVKSRCCQNLPSARLGGCGNYNRKMSKGLGIDSVLSELVSAKRRSNIYSILTWLNKFALASWAKKTECARPSWVKGNKIETHTKRSLLKPTPIQFYPANKSPLLLLFTMERPTKVFRGCTFLVYLLLSSIS